jgi:hypothetical protein
MCVCSRFKPRIPGLAGRYRRCVLCFRQLISLVKLVKCMQHRRAQISVKFGFTESILSDINPVGPRWVQVSAEFPIKNHQTRINLYSKKLIMRHIVLHPSVQYKSYSRRALRALARPAYSPGRYAPRLDRLTRAFGARPRRSPSYHAANQGAKKTDGNARARIDLYACSTLKNTQAGSTQK